MIRCALISLLFCSLVSHTTANEFRAGVQATDITPTHFPVRVNGSFTERSARQAITPLYARSLALDDGTSQLILCVVDSCMMPRALIDQAKALVAEKTGLSTDRMMVSATHTHSAPAAMGCLGSRADPDYAAWLPGKLAENMLAALAALQPARIGWNSIDDWEHTHNRRWIQRRDRTGSDPYGDRTVMANMHPGYLSANVIGPSGPVDPGLSILAVQTSEGKPLALFANYSQHYFGAGALSSDYYGAFCAEVAKRLEQSSSEGPFVAMMSQGTSGDLMWMDYGAPRKSISMGAYAAEVADYAMKAYAEIDWKAHVPLGMHEHLMKLSYRVPNPARLAWATERLEKLGDKLPTNRSDIYAMEAGILHERQAVEFKLQSIRIGGLGITTLPNEVYAITGLKLKARSPLKDHFNIELANGAVGYIPPVEQHGLGGYTTWPARTAGLEIPAEARIVDALIDGMEAVTSRPQRRIEQAPGVYTQTLLAMKPRAYWRMDDIEGPSLEDAGSEKRSATLVGKAAIYLPGVGSGSGCGEGEALSGSNFAGPHAINRSVHLVDGLVSTGLDVTPVFSTAFWFWLGEASGASDRTGTLFSQDSRNDLGVHQGADHQTVLTLQGKSGHTRMPADAWQFVVVNADREGMQVYLNGQAEPEWDVPMQVGKPSSLAFGSGLQGKLDEIAVFDRHLTAADMEALWQASGLEAKRAAAEAKRAAEERALAERANPPSFPDGYGETIQSLKPLLHTDLTSAEDWKTEGSVRYSKGGFAAFNKGRLRKGLEQLNRTYSVSLWFRNDRPNHEGPVTAYLFSRGPAGDLKAPGLHLGIGGVYRNILPGRLMLFNGNDADVVLTGKTLIPAGTWNHVLLVRDGEGARVYLNGASEPEIEGRIGVTSEAKEIYLGARNDFFAPLSGFMSRVTVFNRALGAAEARKIYEAGGQRKQAVLPAKTEAESGALESLPLSPGEGLESIRLPDGFVVELVAAEPQVLDPVAFDWDTRARLWVVEMADYPMGQNGVKGRIRRLEDRDRDGHYEHSTLFAEGLNYPNGILTWRDGVIVTAAPDILFLRDVDQDGQMDQQEVLLSGLTTGNQQLRANGLRWGLDNWVYVAAGGHHSKHGLGTKVQSHRLKESIEVGSRDFRFRPDTGEVEAQSGPSQFGRNRDDWGHWFGTQNSRPLWHYVLPDHYLRRNPFVAAPEGRVQLPGEINPPVYPASRLQKRFHSFTQSGRFTSACGGMIERGGSLFPAGEINAFTCEPFHNLVQRQALQHQGVTFSGKRAGPDDAPDFFASTDRWCRPVMTRSGPDGALYIADMYRYMIEHPQWLPAEGKAALLPFYRRGEDRGRIYRIRRADQVAKGIPVLEEMNTSELVGQLAAPSGWLRDKVQQKLLWDADQTAIPLLQVLAVESDQVLARLHALCTLDGLDALNPDVMLRALRDTHPGLQENALRLAERSKHPAVLEAVRKLVDAPDAKVRLQLAFSLGAFPPSREVGEVLSALLVRDGEDPFMRAAVLSSAQPHLSALTEALLASSETQVQELRGPLVEMAMGAGNYDALVRLLIPAFTRAEKTFSSEAVFECVALIDQLKRGKRSIAGITSDSGNASMRELAKQVQALQTRARTESSIHAAALVLRSDAPGEGVSYLGSLLNPSTPPKDLDRVLDLLAATGDDRIPSLLIEAWAGLTPEARRKALDKLLARTAWTKQLIAALERGLIHVVEIDPARRTRLLKYPAKALRADAEKLFRSSFSADRNKAVNAYRPALKLTGDSTRGRAVYARACAACHRHGEQGVELGPDLRTVAAHTPEKLLVNILNPNQDIQPGYLAYQCTLNNREQQFGIITSENATSIILKAVDGKAQRILRRDIASIKSLPMSLMPDGMESTIDHQAMADLIAFLKQAK